MSDGYLWIKVLHVLSATLLFGTGLGTAFHMYMTHLRGDVAEIAGATRNTILADWLFTLPSAVVQPVTGLALVWIAGFDVFESWLTASYVLYIVAAACWIRVVVLQCRVHALAQDALRNSRPLQPEYFDAMRQWFILGWPAFLSLLVVYGRRVLDHVGVVRYALRHQPRTACRDSARAHARRQTARDSTN